MNRVALFMGHWSKSVHLITGHIEDPSQYTTAYRHRDRVPGILNGHAPLQSVRGCHRHRPDPAIPQVLLHFKDQSRF